MSALMIKFAVIITITMATLGGVNCQIAAIAQGIPTVVSLLEDLNATTVSTESMLQALENILHSQEGLQNLTNILLENGTASADEVASVIPEVLSLLHNQAVNQEICKNETTGLLQSELELEQDNHEALNQISSTLSQIATAQTQDSITLTQAATTQGQTLTTLNEISQSQSQIEAVQTHDSNTLTQLALTEAQALDILRGINETQMQTSTTLTQIQLTQSQLSNTFNTVANLLQMQS